MLKVLNKAAVFVCFVCLSRAFPCCWWLKLLIIFHKWPWCFPLRLLCSVSVESSCTFLLTMLIIWSNLSPHIQTILMFCRRFYKQCLYAVWVSAPMHVQRCLIALHDCDGDIGKFQMKQNCHLIICDLLFLFIDFKCDASGGLKSSRLLLIATQPGNHYCQALW